MAAPFFTATGCFCLASGIHQEQSDNAVTKTHVSLNIIEATLVISIASNTPVESNHISGRTRSTAFCTSLALPDRFFSFTLGREKGSGERPILFLFYRSAVFAGR